MKAEKIVIVGGVAGGASVAARLRRLDENADITMFEKGHHVSFSNCSLPYYLSGVVEHHNSLVMMSPEQFYNQYRIKARTKCEVMSIDRKNKCVTVKDYSDDSEFKESYDKLVLSTGADAIIPKVDGIENADIFVVKNVEDIKILKIFIDDNDAKNISVIGGGFIGIEVAENLRYAGYEVTVIESAPQILKTLDEDMAQIAHREMYDKGINLILNDRVVAFEKNTLILQSGKKVSSDAVVMAVGVKPSVKLAKECGLEITPNGAIKTDHNYCTNDKDIYAVGDAIEVINAITGKPMHLPLAGPAQKQARSVADNIHGLPVNYTGYIGSSCIRLFSMNIASTGLTANQCRNMDIAYDYVYIIPQDKVGLMPESNPMHFKLIFQVPTGKILGAQAIGKGNVDKRIDVIATMIKMNGTVAQLCDLELCYSPLFSTAKDVVIHAGLVAQNILNKSFRQIHIDKVRELAENGAFIIDVREENEYEAGHINGAVNIPLSQIRDRLSEIPKDKTVYLHCRSSQRSYNACMMLQNEGYDNVVNISGSFLGICNHEYFEDKITGRKSIVTNYNFN